MSTHANRSAVIWSAASLAVVVILGQGAQGANRTWTAADAANNTNWSNALNWTTALPVAGDNAIFNSAPTNQAVTLDAPTSILNILFETNTGSFSFGTNPLTLGSNGNNGSITMGGTVLGTGLTQTFNSPIVMGGALTGNYSTFFNNDRKDVTSKMVFAGPITSVNTSGTATLTLGGSGTGTNVISGAITSPGFLGLLVNSGNWTLTGANTLTKDTALVGPVTLTLDASANPAASLSGSRLALGGGNFHLAGPTGTTKSVNNLLMHNDAGHSTVSTANDTSLSIGGIARTGKGSATLNFRLPAGTQSSTNGILSTATLSNGLIAGTGVFATVNRSDWATIATGNVVPYTYAANREISPGGSMADGGSNNWRITNSTGNGAISLVPNAVSGIAGMNTILVRPDPAAVATTINVGSAQSLKLQGILMAPGNTGSLTVGDTLDTGTLQNNGNDLVLINNSDQALTINSHVRTDDKALVISGTGLVDLLSTGNTLSTGRTVVNSGTLRIAADSSLGAAPTAVNNQLTLGGGTLQLGAAFDLATNRGMFMSGAGGTLDTNGFNSTYGGIIRARGTANANYVEEGFSKAGAGTLTLSGVSSYWGTTKVKGGTLALSSTGTIDNSVGILLSNSAVFDVSAKAAGYTIKALGGEGDVSVLAGQQLTVSGLLNVLETHDDVNIIGGGLKLGTASVFEVDLTSSVFDSAAGDGALNYNNTQLTIALSGSVTAGLEYQLFNFGSYTGAPSSVTFVGEGAELLSFDATTGIVSVPEPTTMAVLGVVAMALGQRRRRVA